MKLYYIFTANGMTAQWLTPKEAEEHRKSGCVILDSGMEFQTISKVRRIYIGTDRTWYYQAFTTRNKTTYRLYDHNGDFKKEFTSKRSMAKYCLTAGVE